MEKYFSVYFNEDRIYALVLNKYEKGFELLDVDSTSHHYDFAAVDEPQNLQAEEELNSILSRYSSESFERIAAVLPADNALISQFPGKPDISIDDLRKLVNLEIRSAYPQFNFDDFISNVYHLNAEGSSQHQMLAVILPKTDLEQCRRLLSPLSKPVSNIEISQINAHAAFMYNYPDKSEQITALIAIQKFFIDFSILNQDKLIHYSLLSISDFNRIPKILLGELEKANHKLNTEVRSVFMFGSGLSKTIFEQSRDSISDLGIECLKLNAFRMMTTKLDERTRNYCSRTSHIFPACVGGCLPEYHNRYKFY